MRSYVFYLLFGALLSGGGMAAEIRVDCTGFYDNLRCSARSPLLATSAKEAAAEMKLRGQQLESALWRQARLACGKAGAELNRKCEIRKTYTTGPGFDGASVTAGGYFGCYVIDKYDPCGEDSIE